MDISEIRPARPVNSEEYPTYKCTCDPGEHMCVSQNNYREDCIHYWEEPDMGAHIPNCSFYSNGYGYCPCDSCDHYESKHKLVDRRYTANIAKDYADCDQFVCRNCGIELQDWHRVTRDDDGEEYHLEYVFRFCPNCGAMIVE